MAQLNLPSSDDFMEWLKNKNIKIEHPGSPIPLGGFGPQGSGNTRTDIEPVQTISAKIPPPPLPDTASPVKPQTPANTDPDLYSRLGTLLGNPPTIEGTKVSRGRRIAGAISGGLSGAAFGPEQGVKAATNITEQPYRESYQDWMTKTGALEKEANIGLKKQQLENAGLTGAAALKRALDAGDPALQADIAGGKKGAELKVEEPYKIKADARKNETDTEKFKREQTGRETLESIRAINAKALETQRQGGRAAITDKQIQAEMDRLRKRLSVDIDEGALNRAVRKEIADQTKSGVSVNSEIAARNSATATLAQTEKYRDLFTFAPNGNITRKSADDAAGYTGDKEAMKTLMEEFDDDLADLTSGLIRAAKSR